MKNITNCLPRGHEGSSLLTQEAVTEIVPAGSHYCYEYRVGLVYFSVTDHYKITGTERRKAYSDGPII